MIKNYFDQHLIVKLFFEIYFVRLIGFTKILIFLKAS